MADDIDDLLDEVETKFCNSPTKKSGSTTIAARRSRSPASHQPATGKSKSKGGRSKEDDVIFEAVNDILEDDGLQIELTKDSSKRSSDSNRVKSGKASSKCFPIYLGGSQSARGVASTASQRACDRLHCTSCDNKVVTFDDFKWDDSLGYLFFRNNYPDFDRLKPSLKPRRGYRAYCCQCSWISVNKETELSNETNLKWICTKH